MGLASVSVSHNAKDAPRSFYGVMEYKMGSISKSEKGIIKVNYDQTNLKASDYDVLINTVQSFWRLVPNTKICFSEFSKLILAEYGNKGKAIVCTDVLKRVAIYHKYAVLFEYLDQQTGEKITIQTMVKAENWSQVKPLLEEKVNTDVNLIKFKGASCTYKKGVLTFDVIHQKISM